MECVNTVQGIFFHFIDVFCSKNSKSEERIQNFLSSHVWKVIRKKTGLVIEEDIYTLISDVVCETWKTTICNSTLNMLGIYPPPYSVGQNTTNTVFLDELTEFLMDWMTSYRNVIICGDFNLHITDPSD